jgi:ABC-type dipeptide/oligopeptide/nickel transport system permease subunit
LVRSAAFAGGKVDGGIMGVTDIILTIPAVSAAGGVGGLHHLSTTSPISASF